MLLSQPAGGSRQLPLYDVQIRHRKCCLGWGVAYVRQLVQRTSVHVAPLQASLVDCMQADSIVQQPVACLWKSTVCSSVKRRPVRIVGNVHLGSELAQHLHDLCMALSIIILLYSQFKQKGVRLSKVMGRVALPAASCYLGGGPMHGCITLIVPGLCATTLVQ